jgi:hypothetical protein
MGPPGYPGPRGEPGLSTKYHPPSSHSLETGNRLQVRKFFNIYKNKNLKKFSQADSIGVSSIHGWKPLEEKDEEPPFYSSYKVKNYYS